jgi:peroxiredoxin (alkyl hydroperoxide reductase subunit C)
MSTLVEKPFIDFTAPAVMPDNHIEEKFNLEEYADGQNVVLIFYPLNFTFVCPSELIAFNNRIDEFTKRGAKIVAISVDSQFSHLAYKNTPITEGGVGSLNFPLVADLSKEISRSYGVLTNNNTVALRATFIINSKGIVKHESVNALSIGRNVGEILRFLDALAHTEKFPDVCPANWQSGKDGMKATQEGVASYLSKNAQNL